MQMRIPFFRSDKNEEWYLRVNEQRNILHGIRKPKAYWIGHIIQWNCLLKQVIEGKIKGEIEVTRRWGRRRKKLLDDLKDGRGYYHLKEEALHRTMWRNRFGRGFGPVIRQITEWMNEQMKNTVWEFGSYWNDNDYIWGEAVFSIFRNSTQRLKLVLWASV